MKHVGLNVAADPLYTASYIGVNAGMVCAVADDPGMHSSQNEQDSRHHAIAAKVPMLEPSDSAECLAFTKLAYELSEQFDTPVLLRLFIPDFPFPFRWSFLPGRSCPLKEYHKDVMKNVMMPAMARGAHVKVEKRTEALRRWAETASINTVEYNDKRIGIICAGTTYTYAKEALGERASFLKLGMVNPLPVSLIVEFARNVGQVYVIEELDDIIETHCRKHGVPVIGRLLFPAIGEYSQATVREALLGENRPYDAFEGDIPARPPRARAGAPPRPVLRLEKTEGLCQRRYRLLYPGGVGAPVLHRRVCVHGSLHQRPARL